MRALPLILLGTLALTACKPPATDEATTGRTFGAGPDAPPPPLDSPDSEGAFWANSEDEGRIIYGQGGKAPLMAMQCVGDGDAAQLQVTRLSPADEGGQAFFALVGNSHVLRIPVDATQVEGGFIWQGAVPASNPDLAALTGPREVTATLPGAGMVTLNPSERMKALVSECIGRAAPEPELDILEPDDTGQELSKDASADLPPPPAV